MLRLILFVALVASVPMTTGWITAYVLGGIALLAVCGSCCGCCHPCDCLFACPPCACAGLCMQCCEGNDTVVLAATSAGAPASVGGSGAGGDCCGDPACADMGGVDPALGAAPLLFPLAARLPSWLRVRLPRGPPAGWLAHHPAGLRYQQDTYNVAGWRLCIGCFTTYPIFLAASAWLALAHPAGPWWAWLAAGLAVAFAQAVSSAGLARMRWQKVVVKTCLGLGLAAAVHGVLISPWPVLAQQVALVGMLAVAMLSAVPRALRIRAAACDDREGR